MLVPKIDIQKKDFWSAKIVGRDFFLMKYFLDRKLVLGWIFFLSDFFGLEIFFGLEFFC